MPTIESITVTYTDIETVDAILDNIETIVITYTDIESITVTADLGV